MSDTDLSSRIRQRREQLSLSQEELAARMGYRSKSSITKLEKGINDLPRAKLEELAAALKNVIALSCGVCDGLGYQDNTKALLMTRAMAEITRLGEKLGGSRQTFGGLAGMGDLIVTCTSMHSRNLHAGMLIGRGKDVETAKKEVGQVVEGINALPAACKLAKKYKVEMPIVNAVDDILSGRLAARDALATMMGRQLKQE